jgi:hypothetical protein
MLFQIQMIQIRSYGIKVPSFTNKETEAQRLNNLPKVKQQVQC